MDNRKTKNNQMKITKVESLQEIIEQETQI